MRGYSVFALALALTACAQPPLAKGPGGLGAAIKVDVVPVALNPTDPTQTTLGNFRYAGGLVLTAKTTGRLHGLSDIKVAANRSLVAVSDDGDLFRAKVVLDDLGRLSGLSDSSIAPLTGLDGQALQGKTESDAEGLAILANGDRLVSLERHDRILLYPAKGGPAKAAPMPDAVFPDNTGLEALSENPAAGPRAYMAGGEGSGQTWLCNVTSGCVTGHRLDKPDEYGLVAIAPLSKGRLAYVLRAWDLMHGSRVMMVIEDAQGREIDRLTLEKPLTVDNLEGVAAVPGANGSIRFYLLSDDNFSPAQRTILLAFDWKPTR